MRVVTLARGSTYEDMARVSSAVNARALGLPVEVRSFDGDPFEAKLEFLARVDKPTLLIDSDVILRRWSWDVVDASRVNAMRAPYRSSERYHRALFPEPYVLLHTGIVLMPPRWRDTAALGLELMRGELSGAPYRCHDEVPFSAAACRTRADVCVLPDDTMSITNHTAPSRSAGAHFIDGSPEDKLTRIQQHIRKHNL